MKGKNKWEICDRETEQWRVLLAEFYEAVDVLDTLTIERKNGNGPGKDGGADYPDRGH